MDNYINHAIDEQFRTECKVLNLRYEYPGYTGDIKWAIVSGLTEEEIKSKYPKQVKEYTPFVLLNSDYEAARRCYVRNENKHYMRAVRNGHAFAFGDNTEEHHTGIAVDSFEDDVIFNEQIRLLREAIGLNKLLDSNNYEEAQEFINNCQNSYKSSYFDKLIKTGDNIVDAVINDKANKAKSHNITIDFEGCIPETKCSPTDLCVIFGNTLDNSIEACLELPNNPTISVKSGTFGELWLIKITNPVLDSEKINTLELKTTKNDSFSHGFGLYSVRKSVMKYNGIIDFLCENNVFTTTISFQISDL